MSAATDARAEFERIVLEMQQFGQRNAAYYETLVADYVALLNRPEVKADDDLLCEMIDGLDRFTCCASRRAGRSPAGAQAKRFSMKLTAPAAARARVAKLDEPWARPAAEQSRRVTRPDPEAARAAKKAAARERNNRVRGILEARYPRLFGFAQPLAVGIDKQITAALGDEITAKDLSGFLGYWTHRAEYQAALARGERRQNLDGSDAGPAFGKLREN